MFLGIFQAPTLAKLVYVTPLLRLITGVQTPCSWMMLDGGTNNQFATYDWGFMIPKWGSETKASQASQYGM